MAIKHLKKKLTVGKTSLKIPDCTKRILKKIRIPCLGTAKTSSSQKLPQNDASASAPSVHDERPSLSQKEKLMKAIKKFVPKTKRKDYSSNESGLLPADLGPAPRPKDTLKTKKGDGGVSGTRPGKPPPVKSALKTKKQKGEEESGADKKRVRFQK